MSIMDAMSRFLIVTPNVIVGEDLKEALLEYARATVDVCRSLEDRWGDNYSVALFDMSPAQSLVEPRVRDLWKTGTKFVFLESGLSESKLQDTDFFALKQPFSTEDVRALLSLLGLVRT